MRAQAEQTGAAPQPIRRSEGPEPGLLARASQVCGRGWEGGGLGTEEITVQLKIYTHSRTKPGLSTVETKPQAPHHHHPGYLKALLLRADSLHSPTCGKEAERWGHPGLGHKWKWSAFTLCAHVSCCEELQLAAVTLAMDFILVVVVFPVSCSHRIPFLCSESFLLSRGRRGQLGLSRQVYTHRLVGRARSLLHPAISLQRSK